MMVKSLGCAPDCVEGDAAREATFAAESNGVAFVVEDGIFALDDFVADTFYVIAERPGVWIGIVASIVSEVIRKVIHGKGGGGGSSSDTVAIGHADDALICKL